VYFALIYYPGIKNDRFHTLREKYEPFSSLLPEHLPLIFPIPDSIGLKKLEKHINRTLTQWKPFKVHFHGLQKTWDQWLSLVLKEGNDLMIKLYDELYTDFLTPYLRNDLPYTPHVGLGFFSKEQYDLTNPTAQLSLDEAKYKKAKEEFENLRLDFWRTIDKLALVKINTDFTKCLNIMEFRIK
jgi:hypothetical protein